MVKILLCLKLYTHNYIYVHTHKHSYREDKHLRFTTWLVRFQFLTEFPEMIEVFRHLEPVTAFDFLANTIRDICFARLYIFCFFNIFTLPVNRKSRKK